MIYIRPNELVLPKYFWVKVISILCFVLNYMIIRPSRHKTPYEFWFSKKPNISFFKVFGCKCFGLNTMKNLGKFDSKSDKSFSYDIQLVAKYILSIIEKH